MQQLNLKASKVSETKDTVTYVGFNGSLSANITINKPKVSAEMKAKGYREIWPEELAIQALDLAQGLGRSSSTGS